jgi:uncharacterized protein
MNGEVYVLDACAFIAFLNGEKRSDINRSFFEKSKNNKIKIMMHALNLYYDCLRYSNEVKANEILLLAQNLLLEIEKELDFNLMSIAGKLKISFKISLADSIALGVSVINNSFLVTSDHHEFDIIENKKPTKFLWIR